MIDRLLQPISLTRNGKFSKAKIGGPLRKSREHIEKELHDNITKYWLLQGFASIWQNSVRR